MKRKQVTFANPPVDQRYEAQHARLARLQGSVHDDEPTPSEAPEVRRNRYDQHTNMVQPPAQTIVRRIPTELGQTSHVIDVAPSAQHIVTMKTSARDRAEGFLIATVPLFAGLALGMVLISVFFFGVPFMSLTALVIFWLSFVAAWLIAYVYTLAVSAEGIAMFEARQKWNVIKREQEERWSYYKNQGK